jgi:hypothetical protein
MPRYVILRHETKHGVHFDFMLEVGEVLKTWALPEAPQAGGEIVCEALADHRVAYLDYEGPISGDRGMVTRWDRGTYAIRWQTDAEWVVELLNDRTTAVATLRRNSETPARWVFSLTATPNR